MVKTIIFPHKVRRSQLFLWGYRINLTLCVIGSFFHIDKNSEYFAIQVAVSVLVVCIAIAIVISADYKIILTLQGIAIFKSSHLHKYINWNDIKSVQSTRKGQVTLISSLSQEDFVFNYNSLLIEEVHLILLMIKKYSGEVMFDKETKKIYTKSLLAFGKAYRL